jgi:acylphosphatase
LPLSAKGILTQKMFQNQFMAALDETHINIFAVCILLLLLLPFIYICQQFGLHNQPSPHNHSPPVSIGFGTYLRSTNNFRQIAGGREMTTKKYTCDFEIFGKVQGVYFRKCTQKRATHLGVRGSCMNTPSGTVRGRMEGEYKPLAEMQRWLQTVGSPSSRIDRATFTEMKEIPRYTSEYFKIVK